MFYIESYFSEDVVAMEMTNLDVNVSIKKWNDWEQYQLCHDVLQWLECNGDEIEDLCFK